MVCCGLVGVGGYVKRIYITGGTGKGRSYKYIHMKIMNDTVRFEV